MQSINAYRSVAIVQTGVPSQANCGWVRCCTRRTGQRRSHTPNRGGTAAQGATADRPTTRLNSWIRRYPDVHVQTVATHGGARRPLQRHGDSVQLAVVGSADADQLTRLVWPAYHPVFGSVNSSELVVSPNTDHTNRPAPFTSHGAPNPGSMTNPFKPSSEQTDSALLCSDKRCHCCCRPAASQSAKSIPPWNLTNIVHRGDG